MTTHANHNLVFFCLIIISDSLSLLNLNQSYTNVWILITLLKICVWILWRKLFLFCARFIFESIRFTLIKRKKMNIFLTNLHIKWTQNGFFLHILKRYKIYDGWYKFLQMKEKSFWNLLIGTAPHINQIVNWKRMEVRWRILWNWCVSFLYFSQSPKWMCLLAF